MQQEPRNMEVPIMVTGPDSDIIHVLYFPRALGGAMTACGERCSKWPVILAYEPTCEACIKALRAGTPEAIIEAMFTWAQSEGLPSTSSQHALTYMMEKYTALREALRELVVASDGIASEEASAKAKEQFDVAWGNAHRLLGDDNGW